MKRILTIIIVAGCMLVCALPAMAQRPGKMFSAGFGIEGGAPLNDAKDAYSFTFGATARVAVHAGPGFATFTTGGIMFVAKNIDQSNLKATVQIPFKAGYKYIFLDHFFVMGELGYSALETYYDNGNGDATLAHTSTGGFTYAPSAGVQFRAMELALRYETVHANSANLSYLALRLGFNF